MRIVDGDDELATFDTVTLDDHDDGTYDVHYVARRRGIVPMAVFVEEECAGRGHEDDKVVTHIHAKSIAAVCVRTRACARVTLV